MRTLLLIALLTLSLQQSNAQNRNLELRDIADYPVDLSDIWGYSDGANEYAIVGLMNAFTVVDVTNPDNIVKLFAATVDGPVTFWRDVKTYGHYAYGVHDGPFSGASQGLVIMDLQYLPDSMPATFYTDGGTLLEAHNIFIDENGIAYLAGHDHGGSGVLMLDIATDPLNPVIVGQYSDGYVHDCYARNDTLYTSDGNSSFGGPGQKRFSLVDVSDKSNPVLLGYGATPGGYSHNIWPSDDGKSVFTTDESSGAYVTSHDITDVTDIQEIDRYRSNPGSNVIPHNVTVLNEFVVTSYYRDGVIILDASMPDELVEVGSYDTNPQQWGSGFNGCWGVYPYLPSGNILAADIERGVHVLTPDYQRAVHIRGTVRDAATTNVITTADVNITTVIDTTRILTDLDGKFKEGYADGGVYLITVSKPGYTTYTDTRVLTNGDVLDLDIELTALNYLGNFAWDDLNENGLQDEGEPGIEGVIVRLLTDAGGEISSDITDGNGLFGFINVPAGNYRLHFQPPHNATTHYQLSPQDAGDDELDSDLEKSNNMYKSSLFAVAEIGSFLFLDGGFIKRAPTDEVDTIEVELGITESILICDDNLENGLGAATLSALCFIDGDLAGSTFDLNTPGCLNFIAGPNETGVLQFCVISTDDDEVIIDTTIFNVQVNDILSTNADAFGNGILNILQNPVSSILYLKNNMVYAKPLQFMVSDISGRQIAQIHDDGFNHLISIHVEKLSRGVYILSAYTEEGLLGVSRFIKR